MRGFVSRSRLLSTAAITATLVAACSASTSTAPPSGVASSAPSASASAEAPSASSEASASPEASPSAAASPSASAEASPAARTVLMYALDGSYLNPPIAPTPGTVLTFRNLGSKAHELRVLRRNDDATDKQTLVDLSKVKPADLAKFTTVVGVLAANAGTEATGQIVIEDLGDYAVVDFLPVGTTEAPASPDPSMAPGANTNFAKGMFTTFTAVAPGD